VLDSQTGETLPYSHILINESGLITDFNGNFSFISTDSLFDLSISYLGYYIKDTTLAPGAAYVLALTPSIIGLQEVVIEGSILERSGQIGEEAGVIRLNHKIAYRLPGNGDNAVFNFLRLQPGILAAGERSSELIIWGSYSGHSKILFDGFTIFGLKNFNDNISFVNPYMAKDIKVLKGGYSVDYDDRVGGIVDITGINGSTNKPSINLNINNMTLNGMASIPLTKRSSLTFAYRNTYYNLYNEEDLNISGGRPSPGKYDINVYPDYLFRDMNLKYAGSSAGGANYFISLYNGKDQFAYDVEQEKNNAEISQEIKEENRQRGGSAFFGKTWENGVNSHLSINVSGLNKELYEKQVVSRTSGNGGPQQPSGRELLFNNDILEFSIKNKTRIPLSEKQMPEIGWNYTYESVSFSEDSLDKTLISSADLSHRIGLFVQDEVRAIKRLSIKPGIRLDYPIHLETLYIQPRIQLSFDLAERWKVNGAAGMYSQFISETSVIDELGNKRYVWAICNSTDIPVLKSNHYVSGLTYRYKGLTVGVEGYYKTTTGITRYVRLEGIQDVYQGDARMYGMDLQVKQYFSLHEAWASYTLSKTEEHFPYMPDDVDYRDAPQDQRHEIKGALLLNFSPFFFSTNYVYGSGFRSPHSIYNDPEYNNPEERYPYSRLDMAFIYRHSIKNYHFEVGISILNVLNHENIKYSNVIRIPDSETTSISIHAEAVPFTPTIYLNMAF
ncbi:MAG: TonB-dependent receptor plug domain-containing protein, partial [Bacteroidales bacterium]|nr:TonB-dependent receptor plug domain-containing protein [Bacteroidales bacterium]